MRYEQASNQTKSHWACRRLAGCVELGEGWCQSGRAAATAVDPCPHTRLSSRSSSTAPRTTHVLRLPAIAYRTAQGAPDGNP